MDAIEFYRITKETLEEIARENHIKNLSDYYELTDFKTGLFDGYKELSLVFAQMAFHAQNATMISNIVRFSENLDFLDKTTLHFNPKRFNSKYNSGNREKDISRLVELFRYDEKNNPNGLRWDSTKSENKDGIIRRYSNTLLDRAEFLSRYRNRQKLLEDLQIHYIDDNDNKDIQKLIKFFNGNSNKKNGFSVALTCDFLKEFDKAFNDLAKPDVHIKDTLAVIYGREKGYYNSEKREYVCISEMQSLVKDINKHLEKKNRITVYQLDRMIWLVCTQNFFLSKKPTKKDYLKKLSTLQK